MFCDHCSKLAILVSNRKCMKCQSEVYNNISVLCDNCSNREQICSACLKKIKSQAILRKRDCGCNKK